MDEDSLTGALVSGVRGVGNVVGELARQNRLSAEIYPKIEKQLKQGATSDVAWGMTQLRARASLNRIVSGEKQSRRVLLEDLLVKGVSWATFLVIPHLSLEEVDYIESEVRRRAVFSGAQREEVRSLCARRRRAL